MREIKEEILVGEDSIRHLTVTIDKPDPKAEELAFAKVRAAGYGDGLHAGIWWGMIFALAVDLVIRWIAN